MDFSYSDLEFLHSSTQQVIEEGLVFFFVYLEVEEAKYKNTNIQIHKYKKQFGSVSFSQLRQFADKPNMCHIFEKEMIQGPQKQMF